MGISRKNRKPSSGRAGSGRGSTLDLRHAQLGQSLSRQTSTRKQHAQTRKANAQVSHSRRSSFQSARRCSAHNHEPYAAHAEHAGCTVYCYFCYCCYCCCLALLSFSLFLLLSPLHNTVSFPTLSSNTASPPSSPSHSLPRSSSPRLDDLSCASPGINLTSPLKCPPPPCVDSAQVFSSPVLTKSDPLTSSYHCSSTSSPPPPRPILCRPWPSSQSLISLLLCPPSFGDQVLSYASTLDHIPSGPARPRTLLRQQSLQQPLIHPPGPGLGQPPTTSQSLGQLHTAPGQPGAGGGGGTSGDAGGAGTGGGPRGARAGPAGAGASRYRGGGSGSRSRANPGSWDYMMDQMRNRGLDVKSFM